MSSESDRRQGNAFNVEFLQRMDEIGEPDGAHEADVAGPWAVRPVLYHGGTGFAVLREWESLREKGAGGAGTGNAPDVPYAVFRRRELALLTAAVLPATGRELLFRLDTEPDADGFPVIASVTPSGHLRDFDESLAFALHLAAAMVRSPVALAWLLEAAGHVALEQAGRILDQRVR